MSNAKARSVHAPLPHDSAHLHVTGQARYVDDLPEPDGLLHAYVGISECAHARLNDLDLEAVRESPGVVAVLTARDIHGKNDISPTGCGDEPLLVEDDICFLGQALFMVVAEDRRSARQAARKARADIAELPAILDIDAAMIAESFVQEPHAMRRGDPDQAIDAAPHRIEGRIRTGGQDHFYLEGQVAMALPGEDEDLLILTSSQHPTEVQHTVARILGLSDHSVTVEVRRMGGAFGGKETQAAQWAVLAALGARHTGRPVKLRLDRDEDMVCTGKRHDFRIDYTAGFDGEGRILGIRFEMATLCGLSLDLSGPIADRAMFHSDNGYYLPEVSITSHRCRTHTVSNTAFRGFGGPQGMMGIERVMDDIACALDVDPLDVRLANLYGDAPRNVTPYHMTVEDNVLDRLMPELAETSEYASRRRAVEAFNAQNGVLRRGIALTPVKFGISFTTTFLNQAGALVHLYTDGSIQLNHGGTEMGQGLMVKVAQVVADEFGVDLDRIRVTATNTGKVPNTSATAASSGSDMNGMAAQAACRKILDRIREWAASEYQVAPQSIRFENNSVVIGEQIFAFAEIAKQAWLNRIPLSATGFYRTPKIHYDRDQARGRPFLYFAYGAAVAEVEIDSLTGEYRILRADLLHDVGRSLNPAIDLGQIEGGFIQGVGWLTTEELCWDSTGRLTTHAPSTYKIPTATDMPEVFNTQIWSDGRNEEDTIYRSKAVGEPPLMLGISVHSALRQAVGSFWPQGMAPGLDAPATPEEVLRCCRAAPADSRS